MRKNKAPRAVFFDLDGVLYDSLPVYVDAWKYGFGAIGIDVSARDLYEHEGRRSRETVEKVTQRCGRSTTPEMIDVAVGAKRRWLDKAGRFPIQRGAVQVLEVVASLRIPMWVVTGSTKPMLREELVEDFGDFLVAERVITGGDTLRGKPDPGPYQEACKRARLSHDEAIVVENAPLGIESAVKCGCFCLAVNTGILDDRELICAGAHMVYPNCVSLADSWSDVSAAFSRFSHDHKQDSQYGARVL